MQSAAAAHPPQAHTTTRHLLPASSHATYSYRRTVLYYCRSRCGKPPSIAADSGKSSFALLLYRKNVFEE